MRIPQCEDEAGHPGPQALPGRGCMLNTVFFVEMGLDKRAFLYLDSVALSWE